MLTELFLRALVKQCDDIEARLKLKKASLVDLREERETREAKDQALDQHFDRRVDAISVRLDESKTISDAVCKNINQLVERVAKLEQSREPIRAVDKPEPERTCEVRWDESEKRWALKCSHPSQRGLDSVWMELRQALEFAGGSWPSLRVTNDPRQVRVVRSFQKPDKWMLELRDGEYSHHFDTPEGAQEYATERGWRILREERGDARDYVVLSDYGMSNARMTLAEARAYVATRTPPHRIMRLVPVEESKP